jgi:hypothetical protein
MLLHPLFNNFSIFVTDEKRPFVSDTYFITNVELSCIPSGMCASKLTWIEYVPARYIISTIQTKLKPSVLWLGQFWHFCSSKNCPIKKWIITYLYIKMKRGKKNILTFWNSHKLSVLYIVISLHCGYQYILRKHCIINFKGSALKI